MKRSYKHIIWVGFCGAILFSQCAQVGSPTGGIEDNTPPQVTSSFPKNESVNFQGSEIEIEFDEFIQLSDINNQLIISPPLIEKPDISQKGKSILVKLNEELRENTTYSFNFGEGIKDYTVGNTARNLTLAFSTGPTLDSLSISGKVTYAATTEPRQYVKVMLYESLQDSMPLTAKPLYFSQTDEDGAFSINYLPKGVYKCFALDELDGDFIYDEVDETIGFLNEPLSLLSDSVSLDSVQIKMFNEANDLGYLTKLSTDSLGRFKVEFNQPQIELRAIQEGLDSALPQRMSESKDTLYFFTESLNTVYLERFDSTFSHALFEKDTLELLELNEKHLKGVPKALKLKPNFPRTIIPNSKLTFSSSVPLNSLNANIELFENDTVPVPAAELVLNEEFEVELIAKTNLPGRFSGLILPNSLASDFGFPNDSIRFSYSVLEERELGEVGLTVELAVANPLILLVNAKGELHESYKLNTENYLLVGGLKPNKYTMYCIDDLDNNGKFTTGNYELGIQPESVYKFPQSIEARANWSQDFTWKN
ncbi:MAG: Ig-like domain-containing protein [Flavobacteriales bacterium]